jgi:hypothetical protein
MFPIAHSAKMALVEVMFCLYSTVNKYFNEINKRDCIIPYFVNGHFKTIEIISLRNERDKNLTRKII